uniref:CLCA domain-containing protein n=1 Tax=Macrostomum lignano TaxID=282301 RepID=A0A1I8F7L8_9PLAT
LLTVARNCLAQHGEGHLSFDNNGRYNDVLVSVSQNIPEDWELDGFQQASQRLAVASRINGSRSFAFGHVYILVPRSWSNQSVDSSATLAHGGCGPLPVSIRGAAKSPAPCSRATAGSRGCHVNLHREHLRDTSAEDLGKQLVHEFAHLRWGVFNEYNGALGPHAFLHQGRLSPVRCSASITGKFGHKDTGNPCKVDRVTLELEPDCRFILDSAQTAQASLMYTTYLASATRTSITTWRPPNPQNRRCYGRSVQSVMLEHADYKKAIDGSETDTTVNFTVVQPRGARRLVIVMDVSGSMGIEDRSPHAAAGLLEDGIQCAMTSFSTSSTLLSDLNPLDSAAIRRHYCWRIVARLTARGGTAIGALWQPLWRYTLAQRDRHRRSNVNRCGTPGGGVRQSGRQRDSHELCRAAGLDGKAYFARASHSPANDLMEAMSDMVRDRRGHLAETYHVLLNASARPPSPEHVVLGRVHQQRCPSVYPCQLTGRSPILRTRRPGGLFRPSGRLQYSIPERLQNYLREEDRQAVVQHRPRRQNRTPAAARHHFMASVKSRDYAQATTTACRWCRHLAANWTRRLSILGRFGQAQLKLAGFGLTLFRTFCERGRQSGVTGVQRPSSPTQRSTRVREYNVRLTAQQAGVHDRQWTRAQPDAGHLPADRRPAGARISLGSRACSGRLEFNRGWEPGRHGRIGASRYIVLAAAPSRSPCRLLLSPDSSSPGCSNATLLNSSSRRPDLPISVPVPPEALSGLSALPSTWRCPMWPRCRPACRTICDEVERTDETGDGLTVLAIVFIAVGVALAGSPSFRRVGIYLIVKKKNSGTTV